VRLASAPASAGPALLTGIFPLVAVTLGFCALCYGFALTPICGRYLSYVALPCGSSAPLVDVSSVSFVVTIDAEGNLYLFTKRYSFSELNAKLAELAPHGSHDVVVRAAPTLPFGTIRHVLRSAKEAGFQRVTVLTSEGRWPCAS